MTSSESNAASRLVRLVVAPILIALLVGGSAPWWWNELFSSDASTAPTTAATVDTAAAGSPTVTISSTTQSTTTAPPQTTAVEHLGCTVVIANKLVDLNEEPANFAQAILRIPPGTYEVQETRNVDFGGLLTERWLRIEVDSRSGWIKDDTFTVDSKQGCDF